MELGSVLWSNEGKKRAFLHKPARTSSARIPSDGYRTKEAAITKTPTSDDTVCWTLCINKRESPLIY